MVIQERGLRRIFLRLFLLLPLRKQSTHHLPFPPSLPPSLPPS